MSKHFIFNGRNELFCLAATDTLKDFIINKEENGALSVVATDDQWNKVRRGLADVTYDGNNLSYTVIPDEDFYAMTRTEVGGILKDWIERIESFNKSFSTDVTLAYENKLKELLEKFNIHGEARDSDFPGITNYNTLEDWYFSQSGFPDFSDIEIY